VRVLVIVKADEASERGEMPTEQMLTEMGNYNEQLVNAGVVLAMDGLHPSSKGVRVGFYGDTPTVTDGPFAETKELIAGYWVWKVDSMQDAIDWIKKAPFKNTAIEIRPIFEAEDFGAEFTPEARAQEERLRAEIEQQQQQS
jgi:hypothetical protein